MFGRERQLVGIFRGKSPGGFAHPVAGTGVDPEQHRPGAALAALHFRAELERVGRHHPVVVVAGADQGRWV